MVEVRQLCSFALPRSPWITAPDLLETLKSLELSPPFLGMGEDNDRNSAAGDACLWSHPLPAPRHAGPKGKLIVYKAGLLFVPNTLGGVARDIKRELWDDALSKLVSMQTAIVDLKWLGAPPEAGDAPTDYSDYFDKLLQALEGGKSIDNNILYATRWSYRWFTMLRPGSLCLPLSDLIEISAHETRPGILEGLKYESGEHIGLTFQTSGGQRTTYYLPIGFQGGPYNRFVPPRELARDYKAGKRSGAEATALLFADLRIRADIRAIAHRLLSERLGPGVFAKASSDLAKANAHTWSTALGAYYRTVVPADFNVLTGAFDEILGAMGETRYAFRALPFARHGLPNPVEDLESHSLRPGLISVV